MVDDERILTDETHELAEKLALTLTAHGLQRMAARVWAALIYTDRDAVTMGEIGAELGVSVGATTGAIKMLSGAGLVEQVPAPGSRRGHYRVPDEAFATLFSRQNVVFQAMIDSAESGLGAVPDGGPAYRRLDSMRVLFALLQTELPRVFDAWREQRRP